MWIAFTMNTCSPFAHRLHTNFRVVNLYPTHICMLNISLHASTSLHNTQFPSNEINNDLSYNFIHFKIFNIKTLKYLFGNIGFHVAPQHPFFFPCPLSTIWDCHCYKYVHHWALATCARISHIRQFANPYAKIFTTNVNIANPNYMWRTSRGPQSGCHKHIWHDSSLMMPNQSIW